MKSFTNQDRADLICKRSNAEIISDTFYEYQGKRHENESLGDVIRMKGAVIA